MSVFISSPFECSSECPGNRPTDCHVKNPFADRSSPESTPGPPCKLAIHQAAP